MSTEELIERGEQRLRDLAKVIEIIGEEHYWDQVDFELKYLKPLYYEVRKQRK